MSVFYTLSSRAHSMKCSPYQYTSTSLSRALPFWTHQGLCPWASQGLRPLTRPGLSPWTRWDFSFFRGFAPAPHRGGSAPLDPPIDWFKIWKINFLRKKWKPKIFNSGHYKALYVDLTVFLDFQKISFRVWNFRISSKIFIVFSLRIYLPNFHRRSL